MTLARPGIGPALSVAVFAPASALAWRGVALTYPHPRLGACNAVTLLRAALMAGLAGALVPPAPQPWALVGLATMALALDGVDGWLARRSGLQSDFGARFDMEVDAALALVLALLALTLGKAGLWVLLLGGLRYAFVAAALLLPWLNRPLPRAPGRKSVCVIQIATLTALLAPPVAPPVSTLSAALATLLLVWSFGRDVRWLWLRR